MSHDDVKQDGKSPTDDIEHQTPVLSTRVLTALLATALITLAVALGAIGPPSIVAYIIQDLDDPLNGAWFIDAANLVQATLGLPVAYISDLYGRRLCTLICLAIGTAGAIVASRATTGAQIIAGQAMSGVALAIIPMAYAIASEIVPRKWRLTSQFGLSIFASLGCILATLVGPAFVASDPRDGWRDMFYLLAGLYGASFLAILFGYMPPSRPGQFGTRAYSLDYIGYALFVAGLCLFLIGLTFGGSQYSWDSAIVLAPLIIGCVLLALLCIYEWKGTSRGLLDHRLFGDRNFALACVAVFFEAFDLFAFADFYASEVAQTFTSSPISQGLHTVGFWIAGLVVTGPILLIAHHVSRPRIWMSAGFALYLAAAIMLANAKLSSGALLIIADCIAGVAYIAPLTFAIALAQLSAHPLLIGTASALISTARAIGASLSTAVFTAVFTNKLGDKLPAYVGDAAASLGLPVASILPSASEALTLGSAEPFLAVSGVNATDAAVLFEATREGALKAYQWIWITVCPVTAVAIAVCLCFRNIQEHSTSIIDAPLYEKRSEQ